MNPQILKPAKVLNQAYRKEKVNRSDIQLFKTSLLTLLDKINVEESEENAINHLSEFIKETYYRYKHEINTKERTDLVIHLDYKPTSPVGVLLEVKRPVNKAEMMTT